MNMIPIMAMTVSGPVPISVKNISPPAPIVIITPTTNMTVLRVPCATAVEPSWLRRPPDGRARIPYPTASKSAAVTSMRPW